MALESGKHTRLSAEKQPMAPRTGPHPGETRQPSETPPGGSFPSPLPPSCTGDASQPGAAPRGVFPSLGPSCPAQLGTRGKSLISSFLTCSSYCRSGGTDWMPWVTSFPWASQLLTTWDSSYSTCCKSLQSAGSRSGEMVPLPQAATSMRREENSKNGRSGGPGAPPPHPLRHRPSSVKLGHR